MRDLASLLADHPFFHDVPAPYVTVLAGCARNVAVQPAAYIFRTGEPANAFYVLREGRVGIELPPVGGSPRTIQTVSAGDVLGWSWLIPPHQWRFDARALTPVRAVVLDGECLRKKCEQDHDLGYELLRRFSQVIADRLESARLQLQDLYGGA
ncbi:MAG TPA: cyclic nucleotide-binding domain-containing protein [bacterium]